MKPKSRNLLLSLGTALAITSAQAATFTYTVPDAFTTGSGNWSTDTKWNAAPVSAADTSLVFTLQATGNSQTQTTGSVNDIANPFQLNTMTFNSGPSAGNGSLVVALNISGNALDLVSNGLTTPVVNLNGNRTNGQPVQFNVSNNIALSASTLFTGNGTAAFNFSGEISGGSSSSLTKSGSSNLTLSGVNTFTGDIAITGGTLQIGVNNTATGKLGGSGGDYAGNIVLSNNATLNVQTNASQTLSGEISGAGSLVKSSNGTLILSGDNTYTGKTFLTPVNTGAGATSSGILSVSSFNSVVGGTASSSLGAPTTVANGTIEFGTGAVQQGGTLRYTGSGETTDRIIRFSMNGNGATKTIDTSGAGLLKFTSAFTATGSATNDITLQGISDGELVGGLNFAFRNFTKSGAGTWTLGGAVGNTGTTTVSADGGTLALQKQTSLLAGNTANWTAAKIIVNSGGTLALNVGGTDEFGNDDVTTLITNIDRAVSNNGLRAGSTIGFNTTNAVGTFTIGDAIQNTTGTGGGAVGLTKLGTGTLALSSNTNSYTGATTVAQGTLLINGSTSTSVVTVAVGATLGGSGTVGGATTVNGTLAVGNSPGQMNFANTLSLAGTTIMEIDGNLGAGVTGGHDFINLTGVGAAGVLTYGGLMTLDIGTIFGEGDYSWNLFDMASEASTFSTIALADQYSGNLLDGDSNGIWDLTSGGNTWQFTESNGVLSLNVAAIPEPNVAALLGAIGMLALLRRRR